MVKLEWGNYHPLGWGGLVLKQKIKFIKQKIRQWSISQGHISSRKVLNLKRELNALEERESDGEWVRVMFRKTRR